MSASRAFPARAAFLGALLLAVFSLSACAQRVEPLGKAVRQPSLTDSAFLTADGRSLALQAWLPADGQPRAVILGLHGMGDYANAFAMPGAWFAARGIAVYAYDQRGFGRDPDNGIWGGTDGLVSDFDTMVALLHARYPDLPVYAIGESMGGAVLLVALGRPNAPQLAGAVLAAPAVWGLSVMGPVQSTSLWFVSHALPGMSLSGESFHIMPSDNIPMLRALSKDPHVQHEARADAVWGLTQLMDQALDAAPKVHAPLLILYGTHDFIIPKQPTRMMVDSLPTDASGSRHIVVYPKGYHMLLRDLQAETVWTDIAAWIANPRAPLPSGADKLGSYAFEGY